jgi:nucleoside 2-deoxyribosyltransferase
MPRVYLAGPMFSDGDKYEQAGLADELRAKGFAVHVPQSDGIEVASVIGLLNDPRLHRGTLLEALFVGRCVAWVTRTVVALDVYQAIEGCQCVVLNLDGRVPDEGSIVEATLAWYAGRPVVPFKTTSITELGGNDNPMMGVISGWAPVQSSAAAVPAAVLDAVGPPPWPPPSAPPPAVRDLADLGQVIAGIRGQPSLDRAGRARARRDIESMAPRLMALLEPVASLQPMCRTIVLGIVEFATLGDPTSPPARRLIARLIADLQKWSADPQVRSVVLRRPLRA